MILIKFLFLGFSTALLFPPFFIFPLGFFIFPYFYSQLLKLNQILSTSLYFFCGIFYGAGFLCILLIWIKNPFLINEATKNYAFFSSFLIISMLSGFGFSVSSNDDSPSDYWDFPNSQRWIGDTAEGDVEYCKEKSIRWDAPQLGFDINKDSIDDFMVAISCYQGNISDDEKVLQ